MAALENLNLGARWGIVTNSRFERLMNFIQHMSPRCDISKLKRGITSYINSFNISVIYLCMPLSPLTFVTPTLYNKFINV